MDLEKIGILENLGISNLLLVFEILVFKNLNEIGCLDFYRDLAVEEEERRRTRRNERNKEIVLLFF